MVKSLKKSMQGQIAQMRRRFPNFELSMTSETIVWSGYLRPIQQEYMVSLFWNAKHYDRPYVVLQDPVLTPRNGCDFEDIPHLLFNKDNPAKSGLCLFDPAQQEWDPQRDYIAKTTVPWTSKWLANYENWHLTGIWVGEGILPATVREICATENVNEEEEEEA